MGDGNEGSGSGGGLKDALRALAPARRSDPRRLTFSPTFAASAQTVIGIAWETDPRLLGVRMALERWPKRAVRDCGITGKQADDGQPIRFLKTPAGMFAGVVLVTFSTSKDDGAVTLHEIYDVSHQMES